MRFRLTLEYDGGAYAGWQLQPGQDTIQGRIEAALAQLFAQPVRIYAAGRTDAGVHAQGQVIVFDAPREIAPAELQHALNALLPCTIAVRDAALVSAAFDPRRDARARIYEYHVLNRSIRSAFDYRYAWLVRARLDLDAMNRAAALFIGEHDFAAFRALGSEEKTTVRRIERSEWRALNAERLVYTVEGTAFLRHMVRTMVALMIEVGAGRRAAPCVSEILASRERRRAPATAPPQGLFLVAVRY